MKFLCPTCRQVITAATSALAVCCGSFATHMDDEAVHTYPQKVAMRPVVSFSANSDITKSPYRLS